MSDPAVELSKEREGGEVARFAPVAPIEDDTTRLMLIRRRGLVHVSGAIEMFDLLKLPTIPNSVSARDGVLAVWLAPRRWLLIGSPNDAERWASLEVPGAAITDVSHGQSIVRIHGPQWRDLLSRECPIDPRTAFPANRWSCAQSVFGEVPSLLVVPPDARWIELYVPLSYWTFFWDMLIACAEPRGCRIVHPDSDPMLG